MNGEAGPETRRLCVSAVQMDVLLGEVKANLDRVMERLDEAVRRGAGLVVFPECALSGYCFDDPAEALGYALDLDAPPLTTFQRRCVELEVVGVLGFLQRDGDRLRNAAVVAGPGPTLPWVYAKTHLPTLGVDRFVAPGDRLDVVETPAATLGTLVCYDLRFPEAPRCLGLLGADIVALPTNWPEGAESSPEFITRARAWENRVYVVACNRVGTERGRSFIGRSQVVAPSGVVLCEAGATEETILTTEVDVMEARRKRIVYEPGAWELDTTNDRRPELYGRLAALGEPS